MEDNNHGNNKLKENIKCVGLRCTCIATTMLKIRYLNRTGYFCENCRKELEKSDLVVDSFSLNEGGP